MGLGCVRGATEGYNVAPFIHPCSSKGFTEMTQSVSEKQMRKNK